MNRIAAAKLHLASCGDTRKLDGVTRACAFEFEDSLLGLSSVEDEAFDFLIEVLTNEHLKSCASVAYFLAAVQTEFDLFTTGQVSRLVDLIKQTRFFAEWSESVQFAAADLVARRLPRDVAAQLFEDAGKAGNEVASRFGTDVLRRMKPR